MHQSLKLASMLVFLLVPTIVLAQECALDESSVVGRVVDADGTALSGVTVQLYTHSGKNEPDPVHSGKEGKYKLCFKKGEEIHALLFDHEDKDPNHVEHLFDEDEHVIHLRLFEDGQRDKLRWAQLFATLELGWYIYSEQPEDREELRLKYKKRVAEIEIDPNAPKELRERLTAIRVLYGIQE